MEQPLRPGGHARQDEETDQDEQKALKNRQDQTEYPQKDEAPTDDVNGGALESRLCAHDDNNESLADAALASTEWRGWRLLRGKVGKNRYGEAALSAPVPLRL